ncbi:MULTISPECIES: sulfite exporter TauE/SafE family protein [unclassified Clostridioides]|uniref:sulfite exporter TauE/SafE family protein n=1 Tax=unclassified Clostridioides TaxID=2635829 RepID=UPI001D10B374|nr:Sulfite exporter TauE/SafE [Clostridioides difficile]
MHIGLIYFFVIIFANTVGAVSGMGGGVIIKPLFDAIGVHSLSEISFYSSVAVFTMAIVSTIKQIKNGININYKLTIAISSASVIGGGIGNTLFQTLLKICSSENTVMGIQIILTIISLGFAYLYTKKSWKSLELKDIKWYVLVGGFLGLLSTLLGIGGGPINIAIIMLFFGIPIKETTVYSIIIILFSQLSKLASIGLSVGYARYDLSLLVFIIPAAILGGSLGAKLSKTLKDDTVLVVYQYIVVFVIFLNVLNGVKINY